MQALVFAATLAFARAHIDVDTFFASVAGVLLGLLLFLRFDAVLAYAALAMALVAILANGSRWRWSFIVPFSLTAGAASAYLLLLMGPYMWRPRVFLANLQWPHIAALTAAAIALAVVASVARRQGPARFIRTALPLTVPAALIVGAAYAYFVRQPAGRLAAHDADSLRTFVWYVPCAVLVAALAGCALVAWRRFWRDPLLPLVAAVFAFFVFYKIQIVPEHFWMTRRFLPVILPATFLFSAAAATVGWWWTAESAIATDSGVAGATRRRSLSVAAGRTLIPAAFLVLAAWQLWQTAAPIRPHVEYAGLIPEIERLAARFGDRDLLVVESRNASDLHVLALPLAYIYAKPVLVLDSPRPDRAALAAFLAWARAHDRQVVFLGGGGTDLLSRSIAAEPIDSLRFQVPEWEAAWHRYPRHVRAKEFDFGIYRLALGAAAAGAFSIDVGRLDDLHVVRFHAKQIQGDVTYRWSRATSLVALPGLGPGLSEIVVTMSSGGRPAGAGAAIVRLALNGHAIGEATVTEGFKPYRFSIPPDVATGLGSSEAPAELRVSSSTWNPRAALGVPDDRDLGVMVDRVDIR
jgi:hypothetical protein